LQAHQHDGKVPHYDGEVVVGLVSGQDRNRGLELRLRLFKPVQSVERIAEVCSDPGRAELVAVGEKDVDRLVADLKCPLVLPQVGEGLEHCDRRVALLDWGFGKAFPSRFVIP